MKIRGILAILATALSIYSAIYFFDHSFVNNEYPDSIWIGTELKIILSLVFLSNIPFFYISTKNLKDGKFSLGGAQVIAIIVKLLLVPLIIIFAYVVYQLLELSAYITYLGLVVGLLFGPFVLILALILMSISLGPALGYICLYCCASLASASFSVPVINKLYYDKRITQLQRIVNIILQFMSIVDVFSLIYIVICGKLNTSAEGMASEKFSGRKVIRSGVVFRIIFLVGTVYTLLLTYFDIVPQTKEVVAAVIILNLAAIIVCVACASSTYRRIAYNKSQMVFMKKAVLIIKLLLIPYFVISSIFWIHYSVSTVQKGSLFLSIPIAMLICILLVHAFLLLVASASFSVPTIILLIKEGRISKVVGVITGIMQFFYVLDILSYIYIHIVSAKGLNSLDAKAQVRGEQP